ncbi:uncharacterized protein [Nicotiana sylvestris]|uniref:Uncharacterized protein LOC104231781 isoform X2 n=1 Tax=Nicotiana sylvestris TaxID=4096 RepID=A0A1U7X0E8_NICSY|nr:PREDICTED: uncharacterized protein LOC104231781 isoform X2 [Nicotiana sylvestris]
MAKALYSQTFTRYQAEVTCHEREKAHLTEQFEKEGALLRKELWAKESKVSELKRHVREITYKRDTLQEKVTLVGRQLSDAREDSGKYRGLHFELVAALSRIKTEAEVLISLQREDAIVTSAQAGRVLEEAEMKLTLAMECAQL